MDGIYYHVRLKQLALEGLTDKPFAAAREINWIIGDIFEELAIRIIGGAVENNEAKKRSAEKGVCVPDLIDYKKELYYEVKACGVTSYHLSEIQLNSYRALLKSEFPFPPRQIYYCFFGYHIPRGEVGKLGSEKALIERLLKSIEYAVILPLPVVEALVKDRPMQDGYKDQGRLISLQKRTVRAFALDAANVKQSPRLKLLGINVKRFPVYRQKEKELYV